MVKDMINELIKECGIIKLTQACIGTVMAAGIGCFICFSLIPNKPTMGNEKENEE